MECVKINMVGAKRSMDGRGEWLPSEAEERGMAIVGDIVNEWAKHRNPSTPKGIVFGSTIAHCGKIADQFNGSGDPSLSAAVFSAETPEDERAMLIREFRKTDSSLNILVSVSAISRGFDAPEVGTISMARPLSQSLAEYMQQLGRGLRAAPGKTMCKVLDHAGNARRFMEDFSTIYHDGLDKLDDKAEKLDSTIRKEPTEAKPCRQCGYFPCGRRCAGCGYEYIAPSLDATVAGEMRELKSVAKAPIDSGSWWAQVVNHCKKNGNPSNPRWRAEQAFRHTFKKEPPSFYNVAEVPVSPDVRNLYNKAMSHYHLSKGRR
jgi:superfamily II DNA or RNA helicase